MMLLNKDAVTKVLPMRIRTGLLLIALTGALVGGCASEPKPTEEMTRAKTLVETAEQRGATQYAGVELEQARKKLGDAEVAANTGKQDVARRLAIEAGLDADLAAAKAGAGQAEHSAAEIDASVETLRREAARSSSPISPSSPPNPATPTSPDSPN